MRSICRVAGCDVILLTSLSMNYGKCFYHRNKGIIDAYRLMEKKNGLERIKREYSPELYNLFIKENLRG